MADDVIIKIDNVSKDFNLPSERLTSLKSRAIHPFKKIHYKRQHALKNINLEIKKGEFFGIVGRNGSGKSTLLKLLAGIYQPTKGRISVRGKLVPFIELGVGFNPELSGRENVFLNGALLGFSEKEVALMYDDIVRFAELGEFMEQKLKNYSSGMQVRLAFSMAIRAKADILLIDEVLAVGDADFQRKCFEYFKKLKKNKVTVIFVTHDMGAVREFCDRAVLIEEHELKFIGSPEKTSAEYTKLFINVEQDNDQGANDNNTAELGSDTRWGSGAIKISKVKVSKEDDQVVIETTARVRKKIATVMYGLHIIGPDGNEVMAMNNRMLQLADIKNLESGMVVTFKWTVLNVFNDGRYTVNLTLVDEAGTTFDWYTEAASFTVRRSERSTTAILPPTSVKYEIIGEK